MTSTLLKGLNPHCLNAPTIRYLPNGLTIVAEQVPVEAVNLSLWLNVGSAIESDAINGMAHFLEHMIFKGTNQLESGKFERLIEQRGAMTNAATSQDYTHYYITSAPQDFVELAPLQLEVVLNASVPDEAFERERLVVLEEIRRSQDNPRRRLFQQAVEVAFEQLPYRRMVLGPTEVIEQLTPEQMRDFHQTWYQPKFMTAVVVGNLPVEELIKTVVDGLTQADQPLRALIPTGALTVYSPEMPFKSIVRSESIDENLQQARLLMMWRVPGLANLPETYALDVLAAILGRGRTTRLVQDLREDRKLVFGIAATNATYSHQGMFYISAQLASEHVAEVEAAIAQQIQDLQTEPITEAEISRIRTQVANRFVFSNETPSDRANLYGYFQTLIGDLTPALNYPAHIHALDAESIQLAAQQYLSPESYGIVVSRPA